MSSVLSLLWLRSGNIALVVEMVKLKCAVSLAI
jgi:hypothetical protein